MIATADSTVDLVQVGAGLGIGGLVLAIVLPWVLKTVNRLLDEARLDRNQMMSIIEKNTAAFEQLKSAISDLKGEIKGAA